MSHEPVEFLRYLRACAPHKGPFDLKAHLPRIERILERVDRVALVSGEVSFCKECERPSNAPHNIHCSLGNVPDAK